MSEPHELIQPPPSPRSNRPSSSSMSLTPAFSGGNHLFDTAERGRAAHREDDVIVLKPLKEIQNQTAQEAGIDEQIREMQGRMTGLNEDENNKQLLLISKEDIENVPSFQTATLTAVKAQHGTIVEVPELMSEMGELPEETHDPNAPSQLSSPSGLPGNHEIDTVMENPSDFDMKIILGLPRCSGMKKKSTQTSPLH